VTPEEPLTPEQRVSATMASLWDRFEGATLKRVGALEEAAAAVRSGSLSPELQASAGREAHKLMGSLGTFGFAEGSRLAAEIDQLLRPGQPVGPPEGRRLTELLAALREALNHPPTP
jgi:HPt (histidine-containing phosphotransfer) domain-containing protein